MINLRNYQKEALNKFIQNNQQGIFDMATGTGKTFTSLICAQRDFESNGRQLLLVIVPFLHLIPQWKQNMNSVGISVDIEVAGNKDSWVGKLRRYLWNYKHGLKERLVIIGSYKSTSSKNSSFLKLMGMITHENSFLISDECHYIGSPNMDVKVYYSFKSKLGLSATPRRWWDEIGTQKVMQLFGQVVFSYSLEEAIENKYLVPYKYHPIPLKLTINETISYLKLTKKISKLYLSKKMTGQVSDDDVQKLLLKRSRLVQGAENKESKFKNVFSNENTGFSLVYCAPGTIKEYTRLVNSLNVKARRFDSSVSFRKRARILEDFEQGKVQTLTAMKCLDEGVDVPVTRQAFFVASTTNPREFIQRRGRILRKSKGKEYADIYDFIIIPDSDEMDNKEAASIVKHEIPRFQEFAEFSLNKYEAREVMEPILKVFQLDNYLDKTAWEVYLENKENEENGK